MNGTRCVLTKNTEGRWTIIRDGSLSEQPRYKRFVDAFNAAGRADTIHDLELDRFIEKTSVANYHRRIVFGKNQEKNDA